MNTWITSDLHFGHANIMKFCPKTRGHYNSASHMNEDMIAHWNANVSAGDRVYILGDVSFQNPQVAAETVARLNGNKILVAGNHDRKNLKNELFAAQFLEIHNYLELNYNGNYIVLMHYPICEWDRMHRGSLHFHGHLHGNHSGLEKFRARDAGFDATGNVVTRMEDLIASALKGEIKGHHTGPVL
jgi:calcineurin-like phosphoesterase family protein